MTQKGLAPILIVLLIVLGIGGYLLYQSQSKPTTPISTSPPQQTTQPPVTPSPTTDTTNWKTYTGTSEYFSIKYPDGYKIAETNAGYSGEAKQFWGNQKYVSIISSSGNKNDLSISIRYAPFKNNADIQDVIGKMRSYLNWNDDSSIPLPTVMTFLIDGREAMIYKENFCGLDCSFRIYTLNNSIGYEISVGYTNTKGVSTYEDIKDEVYKILSTFKFTQ